MCIILEKVTFKNLIQTSRCIVPADGYYEWSRKDKIKIPFYFTREDKFEDINKVYEKYRPLLYETNLKEKPKKTTQINNKSSFKQLFNSKSNLAKNISRLKKLYENGTLNKAEFEKAKNKLLK